MNYSHKFDFPDSAWLNLVSSYFLKLYIVWFPFHGLERERIMFSHKFFSGFCNVRFVYQITLTDTQRTPCSQFFGLNHWQFCFLLIFLLEKCWIFHSTEQHMSNNSISNREQFIFWFETSRSYWDFQFCEDPSYVLSPVACLHCCHATPGTGDMRAVQTQPGAQPRRELPAQPCSPLRIMKTLGLWCKAHLTV